MGPMFDRTFEMGLSEPFRWVVLRQPRSEEPLQQLCYFCSRFPASHMRTTTKTQRPDL